MKSQGKQHLELWFGVFCLKLQVNRSSIVVQTSRRLSHPNTEANPREATISLASDARGETAGRDRRAGAGETRASWFGRLNLNIGL